MWTLVHFQEHSAWVRLRKILHVQHQHVLSFPQKRVIHACFLSGKPKSSSAMRLCGTAMGPCLTLQWSPWLFRVRIIRQQADWMFAVTNVLHLFISWVHTTISGPTTLSLIAVDRTHHGGGKSTNQMNCWRNRGRSNDFDYSFNIAVFVLKRKICWPCKLIKRKTALLRNCSSRDLIAAGPLSSCYDNSSTKTSSFQHIFQCRGQNLSNRFLRRGSGSAYFGH